MALFSSVVSMVFGSVIGSFLNVCIFRIPAGQSIVIPSSHCPKCGHLLKPYDNIPILSYLILKGKCRYCGERISYQYPLVETLTAFMSLLLFMKYGFSLPYVCTFIYVCALIVVTFIDLAHQIIPDIITLPGIPIFSLLAILVMEVSIPDSLLGILVGGGFLFLVAVLYELLTKREGMGGGDIKLLAMIGAFLGWESIFFIILVSSLLGAFIGIMTVIVQKRDFRYAIPYGPFLSIAGLAYLFIGEQFMIILMRKNIFY
jgi:leader peptidase (prepilin peptidase) / N-methyltransferase